MDITANGELPNGVTVFGTSVDLHRMLDGLLLSPARFTIMHLCRGADYVGVPFTYTYPADLPASNVVCEQCGDIVVEFIGPEDA